MGICLSSTQGNQRSPPMDKHARKFGGQRHRLHRCKKKYQSTFCCIQSHKAETLWRQWGTAGCKFSNHHQGSHSEMETETETGTERVAALAPVRAQCKCHLSHSHRTRRHEPGQQSSSASIRDWREPMCSPHNHRWYPC